MKTENTLISRVVEYFGSAYAAAKAMEIHHQHFYQWQQKGFIPFKRGEQIEKLTNGEIKAIEVWQEAGKYHK